VFNDFQIYLYDGSTVREISTGIRNQFPQIDGQYVVWQGYDGNDDEIFLWDGYKVTQLTDNAVGDTAPKIDGNHIVWQQSNPSDGNTQEIVHTYITHETSSFANVSSYSRGINGIMVDLADLPEGVELTADDFQFRVGNNNSPESWAAAPAPTAITIRGGAGEGGSDRVTITWANGAIKNTWLEVIVAGNDSAGGFNTNTGLAKSHIFYLGNKIADSGTSPSADSFETTSTDAAQVFAAIGPGRPITDLRDYNRDGKVTSTDAAIVFANIGSITRLNLAPPSAEFAVATGAVPTIADSLSASAFDRTHQRFETLGVPLNGTTNASQVTLHPVNAFTASISNAIVKRRVDATENIRRLESLNSYFADISCQTEGLLDTLLAN
jgi:hypothetical protein